MAADFSGSFLEFIYIYMESLRLPWDLNHDWWGLVGLGKAGILLGTHLVVIQSASNISTILKFLSKQLFSSTTNTKKVF